MQDALKAIFDEIKTLRANNTNDVTPEQFLLYGAAAYMGHQLVCSDSVRIRTMDKNGKLPAPPEREWQYCFMMAAMIDTTRVGNTQMQTSLAVAKLLLADVDTTVSQVDIYGTGRLHRFASAILPKNETGIVVTLIGHQHNLNGGFIIDGWGSDSVTENTDLNEYASKLGMSSVTRVNPLLSYQKKLDLKEWQSIVDLFIHLERLLTTDNFNSLIPIIKHGITDEINTYFEPSTAKTLLDHFATFFTDDNLKQLHQSFLNAFSKWKTLCMQKIPAVVINPTQLSTDATHGSHSKLIASLVTQKSRTKTFHEWKPYRIGNVDIQLTSTLTTYKRHLANKPHKDPLDPINARARLGVIDKRGILSTGGTATTYKMPGKLCWSQDGTDVFFKTHKQARIAKVSTQSHPANHSFEQIVKTAKKEHTFLSRMPDKFRVKGFTADSKRHEATINMRRIIGPTLDMIVDHIQKNPHDILQIYNLFLALTLGLKDVHAQNIVHRDVKPDNIIVSIVNGKFMSATYIDFGFSKDTPTAEDIILTRLRECENVGNNRYKSYEAYCNYISDSSSDIYSLGLIFAELLGADLWGETYEDLRKRMISIRERKLPGFLERHTDEEVSPAHKIRLEDLVFSMVNSSKKARPTCDDIIRKLTYLKNEDLAKQKTTAATSPGPRL